MLKFIFKYFIKDKIKLTIFNQLITFKLLKKILKKNQLPESYLYEYSAKTIEKTLDFMHKKQGTIDSMWLQRNLIQEYKRNNDQNKFPRGSSSILRQNQGKNYLNKEDLKTLEKIDPIKTKIIKDIHNKLEIIYAKALSNPNLVFHQQELAQISQILKQALNSNLAFHHGTIKNALKLYFKRLGGDFKNLGKTNIFVFDEKIDLLTKGEEGKHYFNLKTAHTIQKKIGGKFYLLNQISKKYQPVKIKNVLNTGVYDLLHLGHASLIKHFKTLLPPNGKFIIGLTSNKNVSKLKNKRVVFSANDRKTLLQALNYADKIIIEPKQSQIFKEFYSYSALPFYQKTIFNIKSIFKKANK